MSKVQSEDLGKKGCVLTVPPRAPIAEYMECGGKRSATPLWSLRAGLNQQKRRRRFALSAHSKWCYAKIVGFGFQVMVRSAARTVLRMSIAIVIGPTPPGLGVILPAMGSKALKSTSPT